MSDAKAKGNPYKPGLMQSDDRPTHLSASFVSKTAAGVYSLTTFTPTILQMIWWILNCEPPDAWTELCFIGLGATVAMSCAPFLPLSFGMRVLAFLFVVFAMPAQLICLVIVDTWQNGFMHGIMGRL